MLLEDLGRYLELCDAPSGEESSGTLERPNLANSGDYPSRPILVQSWSSLSMQYTTSLLPI